MANTELQNDLESLDSSFKKAATDLRAFQDVFLRKEKFTKEIFFSKKWRASSDRKMLDEYLDVSLLLQSKIEEVLLLEEFEDQVMRGIFGVENKKIKSTQETSELSQVTFSLKQVRALLEELKGILVSENNFLRSSSFDSLKEPTFEQRLNIFLEKELNLFNQIKKSYISIWRLMRDYIKNVVQKRPMMSVIIPAYNEEKWVGRCIESVLRQSYPNKEIIVVDNNSSDQTFKVASSYPCKVIKNPIPGVSKTKNDGARIARGEVIVFIDADSMMPKDLLDAIALSFAEGYNCGKVIDIRSDKRNFSAKLHFGFFWLTGVLDRYLPKKITGAGACIFSEKTLFWKVGGFDEKALASEDAILTRALSSAGKFNFFDQRYILTSTRRFEQFGHTYALIEDFATSIVPSIKRKWAR